MRIKKNIKIAAAALFMSGVVALNASALVSRSNQINKLTIEQQNYISTIEEMQETIESYEDIIANLQAELNEAQSELDTAQSADIEIREGLKLTYVGDFKTTAYCVEKYKHICGEGKGITSSGAKATPGVTVAADTSIFPYGTVLYIEDVGIRVVQDTGSAIKNHKLDVAVDTHANALKWSGYGTHRVYVVS